MKQAERKRRIKLGTVLEFFRHGDPDEVRAALLILREENTTSGLHIGLFERTTDRPKRPYRRRVNGDPSTDKPTNTMEASA